MLDPRSFFHSAPPVADARRLDLSLGVMDVASALKAADHFVFLDSADTLGPLGPFSIIAYDPKVIFRSKNSTIHIAKNGLRREAEGNPFDLLAALLKACLFRGIHRPALPFIGGAIGYFAYDLFKVLEHYDHLAAVDDLGLPDCCLAFYDSALIHMHRQNRWHLVGASLFCEPGELRSMLDRKSDELFALIESGKKKSEPRSASILEGRKEFVSNFTKHEYMKAIERALEHIYAGDIYQVNLSQRFQSRMGSAPFDLFRTLRAVNPSAYGAYLQYEGHSVVSSSPELFLTTSGGRVETRPIKGTRPRGGNAAEDERLRRELQNSAKDKAELAMIVDLERNDLGRVCEYGSVRVVDHAYIDQTTTVFHTASTVQGDLRDNVGPVDLLRAAFPGGSVTGCPKIRSIRIIDELEPTCRNVYTGAIGFIDVSGDLTLNIPIRTIIAKGEKVHFQVGGGIVADSDPEAEYLETLDKAKAMMEALRMVDR